MLDGLIKYESDARHYLHQLMIRLFHVTGEPRLFTRRCGPIFYIKEGREQLTLAKMTVSMECRLSEPLKELTSYAA